MVWSIQKIWPGQPARFGKYHDRSTRCRGNRMYFGHLVDHWDADNEVERPLRSIGIDSEYEISEFARQNDQGIRDQDQGILCKGKISH